MDGGIYDGGSEPSAPPAATDVDVELQADWSQQDGGAAGEAKPAVTVLGTRVDVKKGLLALLAVCVVVYVVAGGGGRSTGDDEVPPESDSRTTPIGGQEAPSAPAPAPLLATTPALLIKGVLDLQTPQRSTTGKAVQL